MAAGEACGREGGGKPGALVQRAYNQAAQRLLAARGASPRTPRWMALDEFSVRKGHPYQTAICDLVPRGSCKEKARGPGGGRGAQGPVGTGLPGEAP